MTDTSRLPFSPLTHAELNRRVADAKDELGGRVLAVYHEGDGFQRYDHAFFAKYVAAYDEYQGAAVRRAGTPDTQLNAGAAGP